MEYLSRDTAISIGLKEWLTFTALLPLSLSIHLHIAINLSLHLSIYLYLYLSIFIYTLIRNTKHTYRHKYDCMYASTCICVPIRIQATWHAPPQLPSLPRRAPLFPFELINLLAARATCVPSVSFTQDSSFRRLPCKEDKCLGNARLSTQRRRKVLSRVRRRIAASKSVFFFLLLT